MRRALAAFLVVVGSTILLWTTAVEAATVTDAGWWDRNADALLPQIDPPPEGALRVANDPAGASAVAAVRFALDEGEQDPTLVLRVVGDPVPDGAAFVACPTTTEWTGAEGAPLSEAPEFDCETGAALGLVDAEGTTVSFDLSQLPQAPMVDVVVSPSPTGESPITDIFAVDFAAPTDADIVATGAGPVLPPVPAGAPFASPTPSPVAEGGFGPAPSFDAPPGAVDLPAPDLGLPVTQTPTPPDGAPTEISAPGDETAATAVDAVSSSDRRWVGLLTAALVIGLGAYLWRADRARAAMTAGPVLGGLGPFVRQRSEPAPDIA